MNRNFQKAIDKYNLEAQSFDSADGIYQGYIGQSNGYIGENRADGAYQAPAGDVFSKISDGDRIYTVVCTNTNTSGGAVNAIIFGADLYPGSTQPNSGISVTVSQSSHSQVRYESQRSPFWVNGLRYVTTTNSQMTSQVPYLVRSSSAGMTQRAPFNPLSYRTAYNQITTQIDVQNFRFLVDGGFYWEVPLIANETVTFTFYIGGRWDAGKAVEGESPLKVATQTKLVTGIGGSIA